MILNLLMPLPRKICKHMNAFVSLQTLVHFIKHRKFWKPGYFPDLDTSWVRKQVPDHT